jgi:hypothetical protein
MFGLTQNGSNAKVAREKAQEFSNAVAAVAVTAVKGAASAPVQSAPSDQVECHLRAMQTPVVRLNTHLAHCLGDMPCVSPLCCSD